MNLIEHLGGYEKASKAVKKIDIRSDRYKRLKAALLEHRRQHNIFEVGDLYVFTEKYSKQSVIHKVDSLNSGKGCIRHATPEEIKAGRRL